MKEKNKNILTTTLIVLAVIVVSGFIGYWTHGDTAGYECTSNVTDINVCDEEEICKTISGTSWVTSFVYGEKDLNALTDVIVYEYYDERISEVVGYSSNIKTIESVDLELLEDCRRI